MLLSVYQVPNLAIGEKNLSTWISNKVNFKKWKILFPLQPMRCCTSNSEPSSEIWKNTCTSNFKAYIWNSCIMELKNKIDVSKCKQCIQLSLTYQVLFKWSCTQIQRRNSDSFLGCTNIILHNNIIRIKIFKQYTCCYSQGHRVTSYRQLPSTYGCMLKQVVGVDSCC